jgi:hypothetical protein
MILHLRTPVSSIWALRESIRSLLPRQLSRRRDFAAAECGMQRAIAAHFPVQPSEIRIPGTSGRSNRSGESWFSGLGGARCTIIVWILLQGHTCQGQCKGRASTCGDGCKRIPSGPILRGLPLGRGEKGVFEDAVSVSPEYTAPTAGPFAVLPSPIRELECIAASPPPRSASLSGHITSSSALLECRSHAIPTRLSTLPFQTPTSLPHSPAPASL